MSSTTVRQNEEYLHLTQVWLDANSDVLLLLRGENKTNLRGLRSVMRRPRLQQTTFVNADGENKTLSQDQIDELRAIDSFWNHLQNWHGPPSIAGEVDITAISREDFLSFLGRHDDLENNPVLEDNDLMIRSYALRTQSQSDNSNNNRTRSNSPRSSRSTSPTARRVTNHLLAQFLKGKRPLTDYSMLLENIMQWSEWDRQLDALAHAHGVENVLNPLYTPTLGSDEEEVWEKMQIHMYNVFVKLVKETKGLRIVKEHKGDRDAQTIYIKLRNYYTGEASQIAIANLDEMENSIIRSEIPENRRQALHKIMQNWKLKVDDFNELAPSARFINEAQTLVHLKHFIGNVPELKNINDLVNVMCTGIQNSGHTPTARDKIQMYFNVAATVDKNVQEGNRGRRGAPSRNIHVTEILGEDADERGNDVPLLENNAHEGLPDDDGNVEEELDMDMYRAFATFMRGLKMNKATWDHLLPEAQQLWDQLDQKDKNTILSSRPGTFHQNPT